MKKTSKLIAILVLLAMCIVSIPNSAIATEPCETHTWMKVYGTIEHCEWHDCYRCSVCYATKTEHTGTYQHNWQQVYGYVEHCENHACYRCANCSATKVEHTGTYQHNWQQVYGYTENLGTDPHIGHPETIPDYYNCFDCKNCSATKEVPCQHYFDYSNRVRVDGFKHYFKCAYCPVAAYDLCTGN